MRKGYIYNSKMVREGIVDKVKQLKDVEGKKFPEMMKGLGQGMQAFKKGMNDSMSEEASEQKRTEKDRKENASIQEPENNDTTK